MGGGRAAAGTIVLSGVASLVAGAISMALGEYTSVKTQNEQLDLEVAKERRELERNPEGELAELIEMLRVRGVDDQLARRVAVQLSRDPETALRLHVVAELGLSPEDKPSPRVAAVSSLVTFAVGAVIPLLPYLFGFSLLWIALLAGGDRPLRRRRAVQPVHAPRPWWYAGFRQLLFGAVAAGITYLIGAGDRRARRLRRGHRWQERPASARDCRVSSVGEPGDRVARGVPDGQDRRPADVGGREPGEVGERVPASTDRAPVPVQRQALERPRPDGGTVRRRPPARKGPCRR